GAAGGGVGHVLRTVGARWRYGDPRGLLFRRDRDERPPYWDARALLMEDLRAAIAIGKKDLTILSRYRIAVVSQIFTPLYQGVIPAFLFGASFAVGGRVLGLESTVGTDNLAGFIFLGGVISGLVATSFWAMAMGLRNEMDQ